MEVLNTETDTDLLALILTFVPVVLQADVEIVVDPRIRVPRNYLSWQKIFGNMLALNCKIDNNVR